MREKADSATLMVNGPQCLELTMFFGTIEVVCERPLDHDGDHGNGPFVEYTTTWPRSLNGSRAPEVDG